MARCGKSAFSGEALRVNNAMNSKDILLMVQSLSNEKGVSEEAIFQSIEAAFATVAARALW